jgi:phage baseplate assembly protein W
MAKRQYYGIKYPFRNDGFQKFFLDVNESLKDKARSELMHVVFTPKGQRVRNPEFGTDLIKFIFDGNDSVTWGAVKEEVSSAVSRWIPNVTLNNIDVVKNDEDVHEIYVRLDYSVHEGNAVVNDSVVVQV